MISPFISWIIYLCSLVVGGIIIVIGHTHVVAVVAGVAIILIGWLIYFVYCRCPNCRRFNLYAYRRKGFCPHCGKKFEK